MHSSSHMRFSSFFFAFCLILMFKASYSATATANLSTTWDIKYYRANQARFILFKETNAAQFICGFYCDGECGFTYSDYIFAIFISRSATNLSQTHEVIWSANRHHPVKHNAILNFTAAGELMLRDVDGSTVWTTKTAGKSVAGMNLTDAGNLVLFNNQNLVVWQSFDHPTDCLMPGQKLFPGQKLKSSFSLTNWSEGIYSLQVTDNALVAYVESNPPQAYYTWSEWSVYGGPDTDKRIRYVTFLNGSLLLFNDSYNVFSSIIGLPEASSAQYIKLMPDGHLQAFEWKSDSKEWTMVSDFLIDYYNHMLIEECRYPLTCGRNSICSTNQQCSCPPIEYFRPVNDRQLNLGCYEINPLTCNSTQHQDFITLENVMYLTFTADMEVVNMESCKQACLNNCSCKAAIFQYENASHGQCYLPSEIFTMTSVGYEALVFIKVQNLASHSLSPRVATVVGSTIGSVVLLLFVAIGIMHLVYKRKREAEMEEEYLDQLPGMPTRFSYEELKTATENYSKKLGEGGFGSVFQGILKDDSKIAVKRLEGLSHVKKSFLAEVQSIGSIHHVNLVRLRGFCTRKSQRFLVYDFMSNGSLDRWIYHGKRELILDWECRKKIILDIAKGLAYLHEECRQKIIHLDIKPQNILLDNDFNAKVSDFGLSKLIEKNQTEVITTVKGTPGFIAPECWSSIITEKADVYSFGIVLLEILCGRKIFDRSEKEESWHLLFVFQKCWEQGTVLDMVDRHSEDMQVHNTEVMEMMKLASWCLQTDYTRRPSMSSVVKVLEGGMDVESNLDYNFTDPRLQKNNSQEKDLTPLLASILSGPR